ncbi:nuclear transport factor 2 family protein [Kitasatospora viridis]|uniref:SnoaL-like domain-containing protein n=1 Tax=Kitasatospora viridis TaxID=281105 RepID=A0A561UBR2_9ACTN|nr:nuclear transport factor 2 family protein [Kitasatospora viridis]TWF96779.1 hypothetical protein FHX73_11552 [Kitasatospora viridis]
MPESNSSATSTATGTATTTPREVIEELLRRTAAGPSEEMAELFAEDAVFEQPYRLPGAPEQPPGRAAFREHLRQGATVQRFEAVTDVRVYEAADGESVVAEHRLHGRVPATGREFALDLLLIARVRGGLITRLRSYANPLAVAEAFGLPLAPGADQG